jgi:hypothetical protein
MWMAPPPFVPAAPLATLPWKPEVVMASAAGGTMAELMLT